MIVAIRGRRATDMPLRTVDKYRGISVEIDDAGSPTPVTMNKECPVPQSF
jgi:hypothetical protein